MDWPSAFNFLDGSDGLASGVAGIIAAAYIALPGAAAGSFGDALAWALTGACAAFLIFNFPPRAKIFLGDSGSTTLGFTIAFLALNLYRSNGAASPSVLFPFCVAALPLLDALLAVIRRLLGRTSIFYGDRKQVYDLMLARGWSARRVAFICYGITAGLAVVAWTAVRTGTARFYLLSAPILAALFLAAIRLGSLDAGQREARIAQMRT